jgi:GAF domain-containing protein
MAIRSAPGTEQDYSHRLLEISRIVSAEPDLSVAFKNVAVVLKDAVGFDRLVITSYHPENGTVVDAYVAGLAIQGMTSSDVVPLAGTIHEKLSPERPLIVVNADNVDALVDEVPDLAVVIQRGLRSGVSALMISRSQSVGAVQIRSKKPHAYGEREAVFVQEVAHRLSGVLAAEQLHAQLVERAHEGSVLAAISRVAMSSTAMHTVYEALAGEVQKLVPFKRLVVSTIDKEERSVTDRHRTGPQIPGWVARKKWPLEGSFTQLVFQGSRPVYVFQGIQEPREGIPPREAEPPGLSALISVPLLHGEDVIGTLSIRETDNSAYTLDDVRKLELVAAQIAGAVANSRLREKLEQQAMRREAISRIGQIVTSSVALNDVFERFAVEAGKLIQFACIVVSLLEPDGKNVVDTFVSGMGMPGFPQGRQHPFEGIILESVVDQQRSVTWDETDLLQQAASSQPAAAALGVGLKSILATPLFWRGRVVGTLNLRSTRSHAYTPDEIGVAEEIGAQIAGAVVISQLYGESERSATIRQALTSISVAAGQDLQLESVYERVADELGRLIP